MKQHDVKSHAGPSFEAVWEGRKKHEIRVNDRDYQEGDRVTMHEVAPGRLLPTGRWVRVAVMHVSAGGTWGLPPSLCVFSFHECERSVGASPSLPPSPPTPVVPGEPCLPCKGTGFEYPPEARGICSGCQGTGFTPPHLRKGNRGCDGGK